MKRPLLFALLIIHLVGVAQPVTNADYRIKTFAESRRESDSRAYNESYLNDIRNQRNFAAGGGGVNEKAVQELVAQFRQNRARYTAPPPVALTTAQKEQYNRERKRAAQEQEAREKQIDQKWEAGRASGIEENYR